MIKGLLIVIVLVLCGVFAFSKVKDPEKRPMDAAARQGVPGAFVTLGDGVTHYEVGGPEGGDRVMLVHGFSVPSYIWDSTYNMLTAAGYRVARYDYFGRGYSDRPNIRYDAALYDRQLTQLLDSLGWKEPVHLVGLSFGGPVTAGFTANHPERVRSLTMVDPGAGPNGGPPFFFKIPVLGQSLWQALAVPGMADGQLTDFVEPAKWPGWPDKYRVQMQYKGFGRALLRTAIASERVSNDSIYQRVGQAKTPVLLIWGEEDQTVKIENAPSVRGAIPQVQFHPIPHAGHLPHMERGDVVNPLLLSFLKANAGVGSR